MNDHYSYEIGLNSAPKTSELTVLFSGTGNPHPKHKMGPAVHDYFLIHTVSEGHGIFEINSKRYTCRRGDSFIIFPGELFQYEAHAASPWSYHWVAFRGHAAGPLLMSMGITVQSPIVRHSELRALLTLYRRIRTCLKHAEHPDLSDLEAGGWLRVLLKHLGASNTVNNPHQATLPSDIERQIEQTALWLSLQFDQPLSIERIAHSLGYHRTHLSKMFKQSIGLSPMQFLFKVRMERAEALLAGPLTIAQIASSVGYPDPLNFSKQFRKWKGESPTAYRARLQHTQDKI